INLIYEDKAKAIKALGRESNVPPMEYSVAATPDMTTRQVIVQASEANMERIRKRIAELDTEENAAGGIVRVITLKFSDATEVQRALQEALKKPSSRGRGQELAGNVRISALAQSNAIVITGSKGEVDRIEQQVAEMDEAGRERAIPQMIVLEHARVAQILPTVLEMFSEQQRGRGRSGADPPVITANEAMNVLLVRASPTDFSAIESVVRNLDTEELGEQDSFRIIQITQGVNITDLADKVEQAVNDSAEKQYAQVSGGGRRGGGGRSTVRSVIVRPDPRTNSLIVSGSPELFDDVEKLAKAMEEMGPSGGRGTRIIKVTNRPVEDIMRVIDQLTQREASSRRTGRAGRGRTGSSARSGRSGGRSSPGNRPRGTRGGSRRPAGQRGR
ncbi:MAG: hypothetical protein IIB60_01265, partial [Planctomycetes bacterium]|nr:hypothetical protein [Planctomycetota bacterium]